MPRGARSPPHLQREGIFSMGVDDPIWEEIPMEEMDEESMWLFLVLLLDCVSPSLILILSWL